MDTNETVSGQIELNNAVGIHVNSCTDKYINILENHELNFHASNLHDTWL